MIRKQKSSSWLVTVPLCAGAVAYVWLFFIPSMRAVRAIMNDVHVKQVVVENVKGLRGPIDAAQVKLATSQAYAHAHRKLLAQQPELTGLYARINEVARENGVTTNKFEPQAPIEIGTLAKLPVSVAVTGSFKSVQLLLRKLEELPTTIWIEDLKIEVNPQDGKHVNCDANLAIFINRPKKSE